jgi:hypothetical protein
MDYRKIAADLHTERGQIEEAIVVIERLARGGGKRRGRPPAWMAATRKGPQSVRRGRPLGSKNRPKDAAVA